MVIDELPDVNCCATLQNSMTGIFICLAFYCLWMLILYSCMQLYCANGHWATLSCFFVTYGPFCTACLDIKDSKNAPFSPWGKTNLCLMQRPLKLVQTYRKSFCCHPDNMITQSLDMAVHPWSGDHRTPGHFVI